MKFAMVFASLGFGLAVKELPPDPLKIKLPPVPPVMNAGYSGYPTIPKVDTMLEGASKAMEGFNLRARQLQNRLLQAQRQSALRLQRQKQIFDDKLQEQEQKNQGIVRENKEVAHRLLDAKSKNSALWNKATGLQAGGEQRRQQLVLLQEQVKRMEAFVAESLAMEDKRLPEGDVLAQDSAKAPAVLAQVSAEAPAHDEEQQTEPQAENGGEGLSFMEVEESTELQAPDGLDLLKDDSEEDSFSQPENLVSVLQSSVEEMKAQGKKTEKHLKNTFLKDFKAGAHRKKALLQQKTVLQSTLHQMDDYQEKLKRAEKYMQEKAATGRKRMHQVGEVLKKLGHLAETTAVEALPELNAMKASKAKQM